MKKAIVLVAFLLVGCATPTMRRKPGSNVVLPTKESPLAQVIGGIAELATQRNCVATQTPGQPTGTPVGSGVGSTATRPCGPVTGEGTGSHPGTVITVVRPPQR